MTSRIQRTALHIIILVAALMMISAVAIWLAIVVSALLMVAVVAALVPAWRAARTDPVEALRAQ
jgi:ABC-type antimicrobial peptide transport system permease subunit